MCTIGAAIALQGVATANSAYGSYVQGIAQNRYYDYLASNAEKEGALELKKGDQQAQFEQDKGSFESKIQRNNAKELEGTQKAIAGANVGPGSVVSENIATDTFNKQKLDELSIKYNADMASWKAKEDAKLRDFELKNSAAGYGIAGKQARSAGKLGAFNSLLGGASQMAQTWYLGNQYKPKVK